MRAAAAKTAKELVTIEQTLAALDRGDDQAARHLAETLQGQGTLTTDEWGTPVFVFGVVAEHEARNDPEKDQSNFYRIAASYLEEARNRGFPPQRKRRGDVLLGRCLALSGRCSAARPELQAALKLAAAHASEIHFLLAASYFEDAKPDLPKAMAENALYLADCSLGPTARGEGLLQRARILFLMDHDRECLATLDKIPEAANLGGHATVLRGQILYREAHALNNKAGATADQRKAAQQKYEAAIRAFRQAQSRDTVSNQATRQAAYLIGVCLMEKGDLGEAAAQFARTAKLFSEFPEGSGGQLPRSGNCRARAKHDGDALSAYHRALPAVGDPSNYCNPWISLETLRLRALAAYQAYLRRRTSRWLCS